MSSGGLGVCLPWFVLVGGVGLRCGVLESGWS